MNYASWSFDLPTIITVRAMIYLDLYEDNYQSSIEHAIEQFIYVFANENKKENSDVR